MAVKDLVELFDTPSEGGSSRPRASRRPSLPPGSRDGVEAQDPSLEDSSGLVSPARRARFIQHPLLQAEPPRAGLKRRAPSPRPPSPPLFLPSDVPLNEESFPHYGDGYAYARAADVASAREAPDDVAVTPTASASGSRMKRWLSAMGDSATTLAATDDSEQEQLLSKGGPFSSKPSIPLTEVASTSRTAFSTTAAPSSARPPSPSRASTSTLTPHHARLAHTPIPLSTVLAAKAAPLYLPRLDAYIASLPSIKFPTFDASDKGKGKATAPAMFPPMDLLAASKRSIVDLETVSTLPPWYRNERGIIGALSSLALGITGSSFIASFYSVHSVFNTIQIFALVSSTIEHTGTNVKSQWSQLFLGTIPNIVAFNFGLTLALSNVFLLLFMAFAGGLLWYFWRCTLRTTQYKYLEGLQGPESRVYGRGIVFVTFLLIVIYLPLSTLAVHVLVWSQDLWVVPDPYLNATTFPPVLPPLGPPEKYRDPLDFCYTTTMKRDQVNYAPILVIAAIVTFTVCTVWFPYRLHRAIEQAVPKVDQYTELGKLRSQSDMDREYSRLIDRDQGAYAFLYRDFRRGWSWYESMYLIFKFAALVIVAVINPDNCLFRTLPRVPVQIACRVVLFGSTLAFFITQCILVPFIDPVSNASEWTSRLNYVITALLSLLVTLDVPGKAALSGPLLYVVYILTYGLNIYFVIINTGVGQRFVKRVEKRIDFSIDIFSPRVDISPSSQHTRRRIWQEAITALFLTSPECGIPKGQSMVFAESVDIPYPPYLLDFAGSPAERHVENLKILRELGIVDYAKAVALLDGPDRQWFFELEDQIQSHYVGPDCFWRPANGSIPGCTGFFGNAWWIPFPPTVVIRYDDGPLTVIKQPNDLQAYAVQNSSWDVQRRREIRMALRALDGKVVHWPYQHVQLIGTRSPWFCRSRRYKAQSTLHFTTCTLNIKHRGNLEWEGIQLGSGLQVELTYSKDVKVDGGVLGLNDDFDLSAPLARFLSMNERPIATGLERLEGVLERYRAQYRQQCHAKARALTYRFLTAVYNQPSEAPDVEKRVLELEGDPRTRQLLGQCQRVFEITYERLAGVSVSEVATWWYIFWDDLWRRNQATISALRTHASDFDPHYPTSIAYMPLPRPALETFLAQRGLINRARRSSDQFDPGFLNKVYLRLNDIAFHGSRGAFILHLGDDDDELDMEEIDVETQGGPSTLGTGGGTDHDDVSIRARPKYRWEGILSDRPRYTGRKRWRTGWSSMIKAWLGLTPIWGMRVPSSGVSIDVILQDGRYVLLDVDLGSDASKSLVK